MNNKAQSNAQKLIKILSEDQYKKKLIPFFVSLILISVLITAALFYKNSHQSQEDYIISRESKLTFNDIDKALRNGVNFEALGKEQKNIIYFLAHGPYSLEILSYLEKSGVKLNSLNAHKKNPLEDILLTLEVTNNNLENDLYKNLTILISLDLKVSDETIREASKICQDSSLSTCLKIAYYYKALGKEEHATSYARRSCYSTKENDVCTIAKHFILKDK